MTDASPSLETAPALTPQFNADGLIPAIAQDAASGAVLMLAWMNAEALRLTLETGEATYWSRSRQALWKKGETSGHTQRVVEARIDCDQDAILLRVEQTGPACHTGAQSCFYRRIGADGSLTGEIAMSAQAFENANLSDVSFTRCSLARARFDDVNLREATFVNVNLAKAKLSNVNLSGVTIDDANIEGLTIFGYDIHALIDAEMARESKGRS